MAFSSSLVSGGCSATQHSTAMARFDRNGFTNDLILSVQLLIYLFKQVFGNWSYGTIIFTVLVFTVTLKVNENLVLTVRH